MSKMLQSISYNTSKRFVFDLQTQPLRMQPKGEAFTKQIQTESTCYMCFVFSV